MQLRRLTVLYDAACPLCGRFRDWLAQQLRHLLAHPGVEGGDYPDRCAGACATTEGLGQG